MTTKLEYKTNHLTPPGKILREELKARGVSVDSFAEATGIPKKALNALLRGTGELTPEFAQSIATTLGTATSIWLNLERMYQTRRSELAAEEQSRPDLSNQ